MNGWQIALGNLQRQRPPPSDYAESTKVCVECGKDKPIGEFYLKGEYRIRRCKTCSRAKGLTYWHKKPKPEPRKKPKEIVFLQLDQPKSAQQVADATGLSKRGVNQAIADLIAEGKVDRVGENKSCLGSPIPLYQITKAAETSQKGISA